MKNYIQDPINGKWYEVKEKGFTDAEWQEFKERWGKHKYSFADKVAFWFFGFCMLYFLGQLLRALF